MSNLAELETQSPTPRDGDEEPLYEVIDGQEREIERMGVFEAFLATQLSYHLLSFLKENPLGVVGTEVKFQLRDTPKLQRQPDLAFVSYQRFPDRIVPRSNAWKVVPDLAVEVISPTNLAEELDQRIGDYFAAGVAQVWVLYPQSERLYVYRSLKDVQGFERSDTLDGGEMLPGFSFALETLFSSITQPKDKDKA